VTGDFIHAWTETFVDNCADLRPASVQIGKGQQAAIRGERRRSAPSVAGKSDCGTAGLDRCIEDFIRRSIRRAKSLDHSIGKHDDYPKER
jgi:hypothetical protein